MTLVIMAAGIGSRFGEGIKQLQKVDPYGHIIMDYSIHDAIRAGFSKVVFIIRKEIEAEFKEVIGKRIEIECGRLGVKVAYAYQEMPNAASGRTKPYGTCHAVLACQEIVDEPFAVLNADDYYGQSAFVSVYDYLKSLPLGQKRSYCLAGFILKNTLSDHGGVTRGICRVDAQDNLLEIQEVKNICKTQQGGAEADGKGLDVDCCVSMNMWGFTPDFMELLSCGFDKFLQEHGQDPKAEFLIPSYVGALLTQEKIQVKVLESHDRWFGMTYREDIPKVVGEIGTLIERGVYQKELYSDL